MNTFQSSFLTLKINSCNSVTFRLKASKLNNDTESKFRQLFRKAVINCKYAKNMKKICDRSSKAVVCLSG